MLQVLYELHPVSFNPNTALPPWRGCVGRLDYLAGLGITGITLMPPTQDLHTASDGPGKHKCWGYDPVSLFACDSSYGTPDDLKHFIDQVCQKARRGSSESCWDSRGVQVPT